MTTSLLKKRDFEAKILRDARFDPVIPDGGYFIMADTSKLGAYHMVACITISRT